MNALALAAIIATGAFVIGLLVAEKRASSGGRWITKPVASASFVLFAIAVGASSSTYGRIVIAALVLSWIGDVLLIPKSAVAFRLGVASFLAAHLAFAFAFIKLGVTIVPIAACAVPIAIVSALIASRILPRVPPDLRGAVLAYVVVISLMLACASAVAIRAGRPLIFAAALAFYVSDLSVARDRFIAPGFINRAWGLPLYYAAQIAFAWTTT